MPMIKTAKVVLEPGWARLLERVTDRQITYGLARFSRWASLRRIAPPAVNEAVIERFVAELEAASLARHIREQYQGVAKAWNALTALRAEEGLRPIALPERPALV